MTPVNRNTKVLVADSDRAVLEMLQIRLDLAGYHALAARSASAALEIIRNMGPSVLVLDLALPEGGAFELLTILQKEPRPMCPTLLIGKRLGIDEIKRAATFGVRGCMVKPFSGADLLERVAKVLKPPQPAQPARPPGGGHVPPQSGTGPRVAQSGDFFL